MPVGGPGNVPIVPSVQSDALSLQDAINAFGPAIMALFGLDPNVNPTAPKNAFYFVRNTYPPLGAPTWDPGEDVTFFTPAPLDDEYNRVRDEAYTNVPDQPLVVKSITYTRVWAVAFALYGPNSTDRARQLRSGFIDLQEIHDYLAQQGLFLVPDDAEPIRLPEQYDGQWFERVDFRMRFNELVTDTVNYQTVKSVEIIVQESQAGELADITVEGES